MQISSLMDFYLITPRTLSDPSMRAALPKITSRVAECPRNFACQLHAAALPSAVSKRGFSTRYSFDLRRLVPEGTHNGSLVRVSRFISQWACCGGGSATGPLRACCSTQTVDRAMGFMRTGTSFGITFLSNRCARTELSAGAGQTQGEKPEFRLRWASSSRAFCCSNCRNLRSIGSIAKLSVAKSQQAAQW